jgi:hypothetical protein
MLELESTETFALYNLWSFKSKNTSWAHNYATHDTKEKNTRLRYLQFSKNPVSFFLTSQENLR